MDNSLEQLEEFNFTNEGLWDKIKGTVGGNKTTHYGIFSYTENVGWHVGPNKIKNLSDDHSLGFDHPKLTFLTEPHTRFYAETLYIRKGEIGFEGIWAGGEFRGDYFYGINSVFKDGIYNGGQFSATWEPSPKAFENGTVRPAKTLLGVPKAQFGVEFNVFNLLSVPAGAYVIVTASNKKKSVFQVVKTIDDKSSEFVFKTVPDERMVNMHWTKLKDDYESRVEITASGSFIIPGIINVSNVLYVTVLANYEYQPKYKVEMNLDNIKQLKLPYNKIYLTIDANPARKNQAEMLNKAMANGSFGANLAYLKKEIQAAVDSNEATDLGDYMAKLSSKKLAGITEEIIDITAKLNSFAGLLKQYADPTVKENVSKAIQAYLRPRKSAPKTTITRPVSRTNSDPVDLATLQKTQSFLKNFGKK